MKGVKAITKETKRRSKTRERGEVFNARLLLDTKDPKLLQTIDKIRISYQKCRLSNQTLC